MPLTVLALPGSVMTARLAVEFAAVLLCQAKKLIDSGAAGFAYIHLMMESSTPLMNAMLVPGRMRTYRSCLRRSFGFAGRRARP